MQRVRKVPLVVLHTTIKGWCVYTPQVITKGTYLGAYVGEIVPLCSAIENDLPTTYQFTNIHQIPGTKQYVIDASRMGNVTRYFNHACGDAANLEAVSLLSRGNLLTDDKLFFAKRKIFKGEELTFSYLGKDSKKKKSGCAMHVYARLSDSIVMFLGLMVLHLCTSQGCQVVFFVFSNYFPMFFQRCR
ncbi:hypothetical protein KIN20_006175 [Parelaphostrongylus tenuis]|uniref:SET domain-containing protein n=1 Tax=Parelaphostrongylus tenuis TaxID=148309 RepID=A0AAD5M4C5_PARTN|nr:hypothetical protein KIN20_006175 [Parelaphostrongylus tenuis]